MKIRSVICALLCICHIVSITGIDMHFDAHNGKTYVVSVLKGIDCNDIHGEDHCRCIEHHCCNHSPEGICENACDCSDDISALGISGFENHNDLPLPAIVLLNHRPDGTDIEVINRRPNLHTKTACPYSRDKLISYSSFRI